MARDVVIGMVNVFNRIVPLVQRRREVLELVEEAGKSGCQIVVLPELSDHHRTPEAIVAYESGSRSAVHQAVGMTMEAPYLQQMRELASRYKMVVVPNVLLLEADGHAYDSSIVFGPDGKYLGRYDKSHLAGGEEKLWDAGQSIAPIATPFGKLGIFICWDIQFPEITRCQELEGADVLLWSTMRHGEWEQGFYQHILPARCLTHGLPLGVATYVTENQIRQHDVMTSTIFSSFGKVLAGGTNRQGVVRAVVDLDEKPQVQPQWDIPKWVDAAALLRQQRRPELYRSLMGKM